MSRKLWVDTDRNISIDIPDDPEIDWQGIIIHHSATADGPVLSSYDAIRKYHLEKGWVDIGYHFVIEYVDNVLTLRPGRSLNSPGAHTEGKNRTHIGICIVGDFDKTSPDAATYDLTARLCSALMCGYKDITAATIKPHSLYAPYKSCPGHLFDLGRLILAVEAI